MINFMANQAYSSIAPFFPDEAQKKGLPEASLGFIFSGYSISMCLFSPLYGSMLTNIGRKNVLVMGCLFESIAMFVLGFMDKMSDDRAALYGTLCFFCRFIEGFGNGCLNSATFSIIQFSYGDNAGNLIGLTQTFTGLGMLAGPILGSVLFEAGGFELPFFVCGALLFALTIPICFILPNDKKKRTDQDAGLLDD